MILVNGGIGIGTKVDLVNSNRVEVYKDVTFFGNHTGIGGTDATAGNGLVKVGFNTAEPESTVDLGEAPGCIILSRTVGTSPDGARTGGLWFNVASGDGGNRLEYIDNTSQSVGVMSVRSRMHDPIQYIQEIGFLGGVVNNDSDRITQLGANCDNEIQPGITFPGIGTPVGFGTAHMLYNKAYNKHQYATQQGTDYTDSSIFRSYVSSATSALNIELDSTGTKVFITIAGIGSATLNLV